MADSEKAMCELLKRMAKLEETIDELRQAVAAQSEANSQSFWLGIRQALLMELDILERRLEIEPTTAVLRKQAKRLH